MKKVVLILAFMSVSGFAKVIVNRPFPQEPDISEDVKNSELPTEVKGYLTSQNYSKLSNYLNSEKFLGSDDLGKHVFELIEISLKGDTHPILYNLLNDFIKNKQRASQAWKNYLSEVDSADSTSRIALEFI